MGDCCLKSVGIYIGMPEDHMPIRYAKYFSFYIKLYPIATYLSISYLQLLLQCIRHLFMQCALVKVNEMYYKA